MEKFRGPACEVENCGSKNYEIRDDGRTYCARGHQVENEQVSQLEELELGGSQGSGLGRRTRKRPSADDSDGSGTGTHLEGKDAAKLYLQSFQLVLWKQVHWLIHSRGFPEEYEVIVRDLWALRLEMVKGTIDEEDPNATTTPQLFSSQQSDGESDGHVPRGRRFSSRSKFPSRLPKLIESLALCYLGCALIKIPVCTSDVREWVLDEDFAYLRALHQLPTTMKRRLPEPMRLWLESRTGLGSLEKLHATTHYLVFAFDKIYGLRVSPVSDRLLLFRFMTDLGLPLPVFPAVARLANILELNFQFPTVVDRTIRLTHHPEVLLMAMLVVIVKLFYPFDSLVRHPTSETEPAVFAMNWESWNGIRKESMRQRKEQETQKLSHHEFLHLTEADAWTMSGAQMDDYLAWFGRTWTNDVTTEKGAGGEFRRFLYETFPVVDNSELTVSAKERVLANDKIQMERLNANQSALLVRQVVPPSNRHADESQESILRPGSRYKQYRGVEDVPDIAKPFLEAAGSLVGLDLKDMIIASAQVERKLERWADGERRKVQEPSSSEEPMDIDPR